MFESVYRISGASGKDDDQARVIFCKYLLHLFREGRLGKVTLDDVVETTTARHDDTATSITTATNVFKEYSSSRSRSRSRSSSGGNNMGW